jgi:hypothetical protein
LLRACYAWLGVLYAYWNALAAIMWDERRWLKMRGLLLTVFAVFWAFVLLLTGGRFLALLVNANRDSDLIDGLYDLSQFWVEPFFNILGLGNKAVEDTGGVFEPASLIAFVVFLVIGALIWMLLSGAALARFRHA